MFDRGPQYNYTRKFGDNYLIFNKFVQNHRSLFEKNPDSLLTLGTISLSKHFYFSKNETCEMHARTFLTGFFSYNDNFQDIIDSQNERQQEEASPSCISFTDVEIEGKSYCLVSISGGYHDKAKVMELLVNYIQDLPKNKDPEYILLGGSPDNISKLLANLKLSKDPNNVPVEDTFKTCSEKFTISALIKIFLRYGEKAKVTGNVNCCLYPYEIGASYGLEENSINKMVVQPFRDRLSLDDKIFVTTIPCCSVCKDNKKSVLLALKCAQHYGHNQSIQFNTSPIVNSCKTRSSLTGYLEETSLIDALESTPKDLDSSDEEIKDSFVSKDEGSSLESEPQSPREKYVPSFGKVSTGKVLAETSSSNKHEARNNNTELLSTTTTTSSTTLLRKRKSHGKKTIAIAEIKTQSEADNQAERMLDSDFIDSKSQELLALLLRTFNLHHLNVKRSSKKGKFFKDDDSIFWEIFMFVEDNWKDYFEDLENKQDKHSIYEALIAASYMCQVETSGWLCFKKTTYKIEFDKDAGLKFLEKKFGKRSNLFVMD